MIVKIQDTDRELLLNTVVLSHSKTSPLNTILFHCEYCGFGISQVRGDIVSITPGLIPHDDVVVVSRCGKCGELYTFQTADSDPAPIKVKLHWGHVEMKCPVCRTTIIQMKDLMSSSLRYPVKRACFGCPSVYSIIDVL